MNYQLLREQIDLAVAAIHICPNLVPQVGIIGTGLGQIGEAIEQTAVLLCECEAG